MCLPNDFELNWCEFSHVFIFFSPFVRCSVPCFVFSTVFDEHEHVRTSVANDKFITFIAASFFTTDQ